jgi:hypothetical protein
MGPFHGQPHTSQRVSRPLGDYTSFGKKEHAVAFNEWLGRQPFKHKLVVQVSSRSSSPYGGHIILTVDPGQGNHEANAPWKKEAQEVISNARLLKQEQVQFSSVVSPHPASSHCRSKAYLSRRHLSGLILRPGPVQVTLELENGRSVTVFGTDFFWPARGDNPYYNQIPEGVDIVISHGPCAGYVDGGKGCEALLERIKQVKHERLCTVVRCGATINLSECVYVRRAGAATAVRVRPYPFCPWRGSGPGRYSLCERRKLQNRKEGRLGPHQGSDLTRMQSLALYSCCIDPVLNLGVEAAFDMLIPRDRELVST